jgi:hypothetical protein
MTEPISEHLQEIPKDHSMSRFVAPLFAGVKDKMECMHGTAFVIAPGYAFTATHVILDYLKIMQNKELVKDGGHHKLGISFHMFIHIRTTDGKVQPIFVEGVNFSGTGDVALLRLVKPSSVEWVDFGDFPSLRLIPPGVGSAITAIGYPDSNTKRKEDGVIELHTWPRLACGTIQEVFQDKRDSKLLNFPCFQVNAQFSGGMSGGPVLDEAGCICGVISKSYDLLVGEEPIGYAASLWITVLIQVSNLPRLHDDSRRLYDLYARRHISIVDLSKVQIGFDSEGKIMARFDECIDSKRGLVKGVGDK